MTAQAEGIGLEVGTVIQDRYVVVSRIGEGRAGVVYRVKHTLLGRHYAFKLLRQGLTQNPDAVTRFYGEASASAAIGDEHIVEIFDMGKLENGEPYLVTELLEGADLGTKLKNEGSLSVARAVNIATQCCRALEKAHKTGVVHRNIKPENIFITERPDGSEFVKILDFGISKIPGVSSQSKDDALTETGTSMGTPQYMSIEQVNGCRDIDTRTDVYAMGVVLFRMLTGCVPFDAPNYTALVTKVASELPPSLVGLRSDLPPALDRVVHRALAKNREERFASMAELAQALAPFADLDGSRALTARGAASTGAITPSVQKRRARAVISGFLSKRALAASALSGTAALLAITLTYANGSREATSTDALSRSGPVHMLRPAEPATLAARESEHVAEHSPQTAALNEATHERELPHGLNYKAIGRKAPQSQQYIHSKSVTTSASGALPESPIAKSGSIVAQMRPVTLHNTLRAGVKVTFRCASALITARVLPLSHASASVPQEICEVRCAGFGDPLCPKLLSAASGSLEIR